MSSPIYSNQLDSWPVLLRTGHRPFYLVEWYTTDLGIEMKWCFLDEVHRIRRDGGVLFSQLDELSGVNAYGKEIVEEMRAAHAIKLLRAMR